MKQSELLQWRPVKDDEYLKFTRDHIRIAGGNRSAALVYAAIEFRAYPGGAGDTEFLNIKVPKLIASMGGFEMNAETVRLGIRSLVQAGILIEGPRGKDNTWNLRINSLQVRNILSMSDDAAKSWFTEIRKATPLARTRVSNRLFHRKRHGRGPASSSPTIESHNSIEPVEHAPVPQSTTYYASADHIDEQDCGKSHRQISDKFGFEQDIRAELENRISPYLQLPGYSKQTLRNLVNVIVSLPSIGAQKEALEQIEQDCRDLHRGRKSGIKEPWGWIISRIKFFANRVSDGRLSSDSRETNPISDGIEAILPPPEYLRAEYSAEQILDDLLEPTCGNEAHEEAELDLRRARKSAAHAEAVRRRWQLPLLADVPICDVPFLSREWAHRWWNDFKLPCVCSSVARRPVAPANRNYTTKTLTATG